MRTVARGVLTPCQHAILRRRPLYEASRKFEDKGWIAFDKCYFSGKVAHVGLAAGSMDSIEVHCSNCRSHLGHVFTDGVSGERH